MTSPITAERGFSSDRLRLIADIERWHFWFVGRRELITRVLARYLHEKRCLVLDLGCGTGLLVEILMRQGHRVVGLDLRPEGLQSTRQTLPHSWLLQAEATQLPIRENTFGAVMLLDVLEHTDDRALLAEIRRIVQAGGVILLTVPAMPWLWSYRDQAAGHLRRYTRRGLTRLLTDTGFETEEVRFYQFWLFPLAVITRLLGRHSPRVRDLEERRLPLVNAVLGWINRLEARLGDVIPWPWGLSLVVVCRKINT